MKKLTGFILCFSLFISCTKPDNPNVPPPDADSTFVKEYTIYYPQIHTKFITTYNYNASGQLAQVHRLGFDSMNVALILDSLSVTFNMSAPGTLPSSFDSYLISDLSLPGISTSHQNLTYDDQDRLTTDSITDNGSDFLSVLKLNYDDPNYIVYNMLEKDITTQNGYALINIDTMYITSGNIEANNYWHLGFGHQGLDYGYTNTYSSIKNPLYNPLLAKSLGPVFVISEFGDYISKNLVSHSIIQKRLQTTYSLTYTWETNSDGRVISGQGVDDDSQEVKEMYSFTY